MRIHRRDGGSGGLSTPSIIESAPLPPPQGLAHHREQQLAVLTERSASRPSTWMDGSFNSRSKHFLHPTASDISLISGTPERKNSFYTDEATTAESASTFPSPLSANDMSLPLPNPTFFNGASPHNSMTSMASSNVSGEVSLPDISSSASAPLSEAPSDLSSLSPTPRLHPLASSSGSGSPHPRSGSTSRSVSRRRSRPTSVVSAGTSYSGHTLRTTGSTIRGAPHGPYSNVQIVLPAPLAPDIYPYMQPLAEGSVSSVGIANQVPSRGSAFVDQWVMVGSRTSNGSRPLHERSTSASAPRRSNIPMPPPSAMPPHTPRRRSHSQPRLSMDRVSPSISPSASPSPSTSLNADRPPPVPRIPSAYRHAASPPDVDPQLDRGRSRVSRSGSVSSPPQAQQIPPGDLRPPRTPSKLRKPKPDAVS
ncbi:unnamed protein product [Somion occarium]|uniref:Uncharacterized protein n=1 Tax=Somion occarium TaxID=3059160 RepID=A0ABP1CPR5_9APHY